jgi:hypothetical protein
MILNAILSISCQPDKNVIVSYTLSLEMQWDCQKNIVFAGAAVIYSGEKRHFGHEFGL